MSIFNASSLRKLETTPFTLRIQQKDSGVGLSGDRFAGFRNPGPVSFSQHVQTPQSGVAAPADSLSFSANARTFGTRMTRVLRLAGEEHLDRQNKINAAYRRAGQSSPHRVIDLSSKPALQARDARTETSKLGMLLTGAHSLSIASSPSFRSIPLQPSESEASPMTRSRFSQSTLSSQQAVQSYSAFSSSTSENSFTANL